MKKNVLLIILFISVLDCFSQNTFYSNYLSSISTILNASVITNGADGNYVGMGKNPTGFILYKMDESGNMFWWKHLGFSYSADVLKAISLTDSTVAFMIYSYLTNYSIIVLKADLNGNILWTRGLYLSSFAIFSTMAATDNGGIMLSGGGCAGSNMIIQLDANGNIVSQNSHTNHPVNVFDMIEDGNNIFSYCGAGIGANNPFCFFKSNNLGTAFDYHEYNVPFDIVNGYGNPSKLITKAAYGGHYCIFPVLDSAKSFALFYLNSSNQLAWSKYITTPDTLFRLAQVIGTPDNGCIAIASNFKKLVFPPISLQAIMKFDSTGNLEWSKMLGDSATANWNNMRIKSVLPATDNGWLSTVFGGGIFNICKTDSAFNGFCYNTPFNPIITDFTPVESTYTLTSSTLNFTADSLYLNSIPIPVYKTDECSNVSDQQININKSSFSIFPNPVTSEISINIERQNMSQVTYSIKNILGKTVIIEHENNLINSLTKTIDLSTLSNGVYVLDVIIDGERTVKKFVKE